MNKTIDNLKELDDTINNMHKASPTPSQLPTQVLALAELKGTPEAADIISKAVNEHKHHHTNLSPQPLLDDILTAEIELELAEKEAAAAQKVVDTHKELDLPLEITHPADTRLKKAKQRINQLQHKLISLNQQMEHHQQQIPEAEQRLKILKKADKLAQQLLKKGTLKGADNTLFTTLEPTPKDGSSILKRKSSGLAQHTNRDYYFRY